MTTPELHPWLSTPEAYEAARKSVAIPMSLMAGKAVIVGADELLSEALAVLAECALPPRDQLPTQCAKCGGSLEGLRTGAKFCSKRCRTNYAVDVTRAKASTVPPRTGAHIGSMWGWPETERSKYAVREVGYVLNNYLRTAHHAVETPIDWADTMVRRNGKLEAQGEQDVHARDIIEEYLESKGVRTDGTESIEELTEAVDNIKKAES